MKNCYRILWSVCEQTYVASSNDFVSVKKQHKMFKTSQYVLSGLLAAFFVSDACAASYDYSDSVMTTITVNDGDAPVFHGLIFVVV